jgi:lysophospholipase L1-like esterase
MAAGGNSISAGVFASSEGSYVEKKKSFKHWLVERPRYSFATGDKVNSHCSRLKRDFGSFECKNFAVSGSKIEDLYLDQVPKIVDYNPDYVLIEIGANNACSSNPISGQIFYNTFANIAADLYKSQRAVVVTSVPDIMSLLAISDRRGIIGLKAKKIWKIFGSCKSVLQDKNDISGIIKDYNDALKDISKSYGFYYADITFPLDHTLVSNIDFFHPSRKGHELLAAMSYPFGGNNGE